MDLKHLTLACVLLALPLLAVATEVEVEGLFKGAVLLRIDGDQHLLRDGQSIGGVHLISADSKAAIMEYDGQRHSQSVHQRISAHYAEPELLSVAIAKNPKMQYITTAVINGYSTRVLVDTGANVVAMNAAQARAMGLAYRQGSPATVTTASGQVDAFTVNLNIIEIGGIQVRNVKATVIEGDYPSMVLLGMSYLQHVEMRENDGILMLLQKY